MGDPVSHIGLGRNSPTELALLDDTEDHKGDGHDLEVFEDIKKPGGSQKALQLLNRLFERVSSPSSSKVVVLTTKQFQDWLDLEAFKSQQHFNAIDDDRNGTLSLLEIIRYLYRLVRDSQRPEEVQRFKVGLCFSMFGTLPKHLAHATLPTGLKQQPIMVKSDVEYMLHNLLASMTYRREDSLLQKVQGMSERVMEFASPGNHFMYGKDPTVHRFLTLENFEKCIEDPEFGFIMKMWVFLGELEKEDEVKEEALPLTEYWATAMQSAGQATDAMAEAVARFRPQAEDRGTHEALARRVCGCEDIVAQLEQFWPWKQGESCAIA